jgi:hypothetical protein
MGGGAVSELVEEVSAVVAGPDDLCRARSALGALRRLRGWCDAKDVALTAMVARCTPAPEGHVKQAGGLSDREAEQRTERARTAGELEPLGEALAGGEIRGEHVDAVARVRGRLDPVERERFDRTAEELAGMARRSDPATFARYVARQAQRARARDGEDELARQRRAARCRTYVSRESGMWVLHLEVDPRTGVELDAQVRAALEALFSGAPPETCPSDPLEKQDHLRALAVSSMLLGQAGSAGPPEVIVVVDTRCAAHSGVDGAGAERTVEHQAASAAADDHRHPADPAATASRCTPGHDRPVVDWGLPVELPPSVLTDLYPRATITTVVLCRGAVLHAPGRLDLGRTTRLANRAQRRVLRAMYPSCAIPDCPVRFDHCKIHHVVWWRHGGSTDLHNLLPICVKHHTAVHDRGWTLQLQPDRTLTVTPPDGNPMTTGPPARHAA